MVKIEILIYGFFISFFGFFAVAIVYQLNSMLMPKAAPKIELYDNGDYSQNLNIVIASRVGDGDIRNSVRYNIGLYFTKEEYEQYRYEVLKTELP